MQSSEWKPEIRLPSVSDHIVLSGLEWDTEYNIYVVAENQKGKSQPATMSFRTSSEPEAIPGSVPDPVTHTNVELNSQKPEEPNSNLKTRAACSIFKSGALTGEWQLNKSIEKINRFRGRRWAKNDFPAEFSHFKVLTALTKWAWVCACRSGTHTHTEDKMISSECL